MEEAMKKITQLTLASLKISMLVLLFFVTAAPTAVEYAVKTNDLSGSPSNGEVTGLRGDHPGNRLIQRQGSRNSSDKNRKANSAIAAPFVPGGAVLGIKKDGDGNTKLDADPARDELAGGGDLDVDADSSR